MIRDPKGRYIGIVQDSVFSTRDFEAGGWWVLTHDGAVRFGHPLSPPETGFGIVSERADIPRVLLRTLIDVMEAVGDADTCTVEEWDDPDLELFADVLRAGLGGTMEEAEEIGGMLLDRSVEDGRCPWQLAAFYISDYGSGDVRETSPVVPPKAAQKADPRKDAKIIPFPVHLVRPPAGK